jgi:hypothetical protein
MENTVKERIITFMRYKNISVSAFERRCKFSNGYLRALKHEPSLGKLEEILLEFPELNKNWLLTGEGEMLNTTPISQHVENSDHISQFGDVNSMSEEIINKFLEEIAAQRKTTEKVQEQMSVAQEQITRLIAILERK